MAKSKTKRAQFKGPLPLAQGTVIRYESHTLTLTAHLALRGEDNGEEFEWDEYEFVDAQGNCWYLECDEGHWRLMHAFTPATPPPADELLHGHLLHFGTQGARVLERGEGYVCRTEGTLHGPLVYQQQVAYVDATYKKQWYSVEWSGGATRYYTGKQLSPAQVSDLTGIHLQRISRDASQAWRNPFAAMMAIAGVIAILIGVLFDNTGRELISKSIPLAQATGEGVRYGPYDLPSGQAKLELSTNIHEAECYEAVVLEDPKGLELLTLEGDFWDESGVDSEGSWHESEISCSKYFTIDLPGTYYMRVYTEPSATRPPYGGELTYTVSSKIGNPLSLYWTGGILLFLALFFRKNDSSDNDDD